MITPSTIIPYREASQPSAPQGPQPRTSLRWQAATAAALRRPFAPCRPLQHCRCSPSSADRSPGSRVCCSCWCRWVDTRPADTDHRAGRLPFWVADMSLLWMFANPQASVALRRLESFLLAKEVVELPVGPGVEPTEPDAGRGGHPVLPRLHDPASVCYHRSPQVPEGATDSTALVTIKGELLPLPSPSTVLIGPCQPSAHTQTPPNTTPTHSHSQYRCRRGNDNYLPHRIIRLRVLRIQVPIRLQEPGSWL